MVRAGLNIFNVLTVGFQVFWATFSLFSVAKEKRLFRHSCSECYHVGRASTGDACLHAEPRRPRRCLKGEWLHAASIATGLVKCVTASWVLVNVSLSPVVYCSVGSPYCLMPLVRRDCSFSLQVIVPFSLQICVLFCGVCVFLWLA